MKIPLVLLPGLLSDKRVWMHQIQHLKDVADVQIISLSQDTPEKMIHSLLEEAPPKFALAGHSMGGWLCLEVMRVAPERVTQLCLINTTSRMDTEEKREKRYRMIEKAEEGSFQEIVKDIVGKFVFNPLVKNDVEKMFLDLGKTVFIHQEQAMIKRKDTRSLLATIFCPVLVIHAAQDSVFSLDEHIELVAQMPNAKLALVEDAGHMSPMEMPQAITALLRYWLTYF
jgi:pimeloyl-ACP methyl ester carboxylesterase